MAGSLLLVKTCWVLFILPCLRVVSSQKLYLSSFPTRPSPGQNVTLICDANLDIGSDPIIWMNGETQVLYTSRSGAHIFPPDKLGLTGRVYVATASHQHNIAISVNMRDMWQPWMCRSNVKSVSSNELDVSIATELLLSSFPTRSSHGQNVTLICEANFNIGSNAITWLNGGTQMLSTQNSRALIRNSDKLTGRVYVSTDYHQHNLTITVNTTGDMWAPWTCRSNVYDVSSNELDVSIDLDLTSSTGVPSIINTSSVNAESTSSSAPTENHSTKILITEPTPAKATETLNNEPTSNIAPVVYAVVGAVVGVVGTLLLVLLQLVLFCLFRQGRLQCVKPTPVSVDSVQMDNMDGQQPANIAQQAGDVSHTSSNIYDVLDSETKASAKDYEAIVTNTYQNV